MSKKKILGVGSKTKKANIKKCSICKKPKPFNCKFKTCNACRERASAQRQKLRENKIECHAIKENGEKCTNKVSEACGNKYCEIHITEWKNYKQTKGKTVKRCNSRTQCDPDNPGIKAVLPANYKKKKCENCLEKEREMYLKKRAEIDELNNNSTNEQYCLKCKSQIPIDKIILTKHDQVSLYCNRCFIMRQKSERNRK